VSFNRWRGLAKARIEKQLIRTEEPNGDNEDEPMEVCK